MFRDTQVTLLIQSLCVKALTGVLILDEFSRIDEEIRQNWKIIALPEEQTEERYAMVLEMLTHIHDIVIHYPLNKEKCVDLERFIISENAAHLRIIYHLIEFNAGVKELDVLKSRLKDVNINHEAVRDILRRI